MKACQECISLTRRLVRHKIRFAATCLDCGRMWKHVPKPE